MRGLLTAGLLGLALAAAEGTAVAGCDGSFVIRNDSTSTIRYQVRWGEGEWESFSVPPGYRQAHFHALDEYERAPAPQVRFDYIGGDNAVTFKTYDVDFYSVYDPFRGKPHVFRYSPCGRYLDLYRQ